ncbi:MAG: ABC transporter permease subunit [Candidatus Saccharibacteria bacterium]|nr:ABC transporter permease subunit [Candidatus Saccharibacteria bacterium]
MRIANIYKQELKFYRRSTIIWMLVFALGVFGYLSLFNSFTQDVAATTKILEGMPPVVRAALGIQLKSFFSIFGFFGYLLTYFWMVGAVQASNLGIGINSKEVSGKTADFLLSKPVSRFKVLTSKLLAALTLIILTNIVFSLSSYFSALIFSKTSFDAKIFFLVCSSMFFVQLFFLVLGYLISVLVPKVKTVIAYSLPLVFGFFIFGLLDSVIGVGAMRYITPFKYFDVMYIIAHKSFEYEYLLVEAAVIVVCLIATYIIYLSKDIQAAA